jgi:phosphoribosylaminoimidazolecarboxamide formyltransferase/IMP cyclohydrolase
MQEVTISSALISVYYKEGLDTLVDFLHENGVSIYATGGTYDFICSRGIPAVKVESITGFPEMLEGRVKTLHPAVFAGILAKRNENDLAQMAEMNLPLFDLIIVNLYPFSETLSQTNDHQKLIEKIDIGGVSLIRAAAKNYEYTSILSQQKHYAQLESILRENRMQISLEDRQRFAAEAFNLTVAYDTAIGTYLSEKAGLKQSTELKYGENPHQKAHLSGDLSIYFQKLSGKDLSYNNLLDINAALKLLHDFNLDKPVFAIFKHNNPCGVATGASLLESWQRALACDPLSAFGGILICNKEMDLPTAKEIDSLFFEVLLCPGYEKNAFTLLKKKSKRIILQTKSFAQPEMTKRSFGDLILEQSTDNINPFEEELRQVTNTTNTIVDLADVHFAIACVKHLKSNAIAIVKGQQMIGAGAGQTSRIDALEQAISKAKRMGFSLDMSVLASDAFFPFTDSVEQIAAAGIPTIVQPGGSIKDPDVIAYCNAQGLNMFFTGIRHFNH